ncbi:hypothetical protein HID58_026866 [Brassica napus]|uniref:AMP-dependent synthetase/ligase domain-containing protein n=1 Tax=Brassica napus TaxID=3708 RepID=A0ABQ8CSE0_BRANA|nr:hypothetical protein HID58_026866 [Brassica napus]
MIPYAAGVIVPLALTLLVRNAKKDKKRGVVVDDVGGEPGHTVRNHRFKDPVSSHWEDISTLPELFEISCKSHSERFFLGTRRLIAREVETSEDGKVFEKLHLGDYEWKTFGETLDAVCSFASGLVQIGHKSEERVAIFADTREEWFIALQGCFRRNVTVVTIYSSLGEEALCHSLNETEVTTVICGNKELKKLMDISQQLETVKRVICMDDEFPSEASSTWTTTSLADVQKLGRESPVDPSFPLSADVAVIMYTSGSTGLPKGVMMTHGNVLATVSAVMTIVPDLGKRDTYMAYLPLAHILELAAESVMATIGSAIGYGSPLTLTDTSNKIKKGTKGDVTALKPTIMTAVPAILDRVRDGVRKKVDAKGGAAKKLFDFAYARRLSAINGSWFGAWGLEKLLWDVLVFGKIRAVLGGQLRYLLSGGAPLSGDTQRFINICVGAPIGQGYGLTETCAGGTFSEFDDTSVGRVGAPLPCSFVKLIDWPEGGYLISDKPMPRGEIVIGGSNITLGYFKNEEKTKEVYKVEAALSISPYVENIMVHADPFYSYCVALVVAAQQTLEGWASKQGIEFTNFEELCAKEQAVKEVYASLVKAAKQSRLEKFEIPAKIKVLAAPWTPESGLVTAALKLKRDVIRKEFSEDLTKLYAS